MDKIRRNNKRIRKNSANSHDAEGTGHLGERECDYPAGQKTIRRVLEISKGYGWSSELTKDLENLEKRLLETGEKDHKPLENLMALIEQIHKNFGRGPSVKKFLDQYLNQLKDLSGSNLEDSIDQVASLLRKTLLQANDGFKSLSEQSQQYILKELEENPDNMEFVTKLLNDGKFKTLIKSDKYKALGEGHKYMKNKRATQVGLLDFLLKESDLKWLDRYTALFENGFEKMDDSGIDAILNCIKHNPEREDDIIALLNPNLGNEAKRLLFTSINKYPKRMKDLSELANSKICNLDELLQQNMFLIIGTQDGGEEKIDIFRQLLTNPQSEDFVESLNSTFQELRGFLKYEFNLNTGIIDQSLVEVFEKKIFQERNPTKIVEWVASLEKVVQNRDFKDLINSSAKRLILSITNEDLDKLVPYEKIINRGALEHLSVQEKAEVLEGLHYQDTDKLNAFADFLKSSQAYKALSPELKGELIMLLSQDPKELPNLAKLIESKEFQEKIFSEKLQVRLINLIIRRPSETESIINFITTSAFKPMFQELNEGQLDILFQIYTESKFDSLSAENKGELMKLIENLPKLRFYENLLHLPKWVRENNLQAINNALKNELEATARFQTDLKRMEVLGQIKSLLKRQPEEAVEEGVIYSEGIKPSSVLSSKEKAYGLKGRFPYTLSEAQLKLWLGAEYISSDQIPKDDITTEELRIRANVRKLFQTYYPVALEPGDENEIFIKNIEEVLRQERINGDKFVFYHGASGAIGGVYEMYSWMRSLLLMDNTGNAVSVLRAFDDAFASISDVGEFVNAMDSLYAEDSSSGYNYLKGYMDRGINANVGIFGNLKNPASMTLAYFFTSSVSKDISLETIMGKVLSQLWQRSEDNVLVQTRAKEYSDLFKEWNSTNGGILLQIFVNEKNLDDVGYVAESRGKPLDFYEDGDKGKALTHAFSKSLPEYRSDPEAFKAVAHANKSQFTASPVEGDMDVDAIEARLFVNPKLFADQNKVSIKQYYSKVSPTEGRESVALRGRLEKMVNEDVTAFLSTRETLPVTAVTQMEGQRLTPLQNYNRLVPVEYVGPQDDRKGEFPITTPFQYDLKIVKHAKERSQMVSEAVAARKTEDYGALSEVNERIKDHSQFEISGQKKDHERAAKMEAMPSDEVFNHAEDPHKADLANRAWFMDADHTPEEIVEYLKGYPELKALYGAYDSFSRKVMDKHAIEVMQQFEAQKGFLDTLGLPAEKVESLTRLMRVVIAFHDIAKPNDHEYQHEYSVPVMIRYMVKMRFEEKEINLAVSLIDHDLFGDYVRDDVPGQIQKSATHTREALEAYADEEIIGENLKTYAALQYLFYASDATSYEQVKSSFSPDPKYNGLMIAAANPGIEKFNADILGTSTTEGTEAE